MLHLVYVQHKAIYFTEGCKKYSNLKTDQSDLLILIFKILFEVGGLSQISFLMKALHSQ